ncbi:MAG: substrate-binding domain-containing protein [Bacilli bacterium]
MKRNTKSLSVLMTLSLLIAGCASTSSSSSTTSVSSSTSSSFESHDITVYTRDATSGTRDGLQSILGFSGSEMVATAVEVTDNGDMINKVKNDPYGIGYISLSTLTDAEQGGFLHGVNYEGIQASEDHVLDNSYGLKRPFNYVTRASGDFDSAEKEQLVEAFITFFTLTYEGKSSISAKHGILEIDEELDPTWVDDYQSQYQSLCQLTTISPVKLVGSTSVSSTIQNAANAFKNVCPSFSFSADLTGSGDGHKRVLGVNKDTTYGDIGFASRSFSMTEDVSSAKASGTYALDAIVIVVGKNVTLSNLTQQQAKDIFTGVVTAWYE